MFTLDYARVGYSIISEKHHDVIQILKLSRYFTIESIDNIDKNLE
jgi:hypothetical protein